MATLDELLAQEINERAQQRSFRPPGLLIEPGGEDEQPRPFTDDEVDGIKHDFLDRAGHALGLIPKTAMRVLTLATEPIARADTLLRASVLTATGRIPLDEYGEWFRDSLEGKRHINGTDFWQMALSNETFETLRNTNLIPGWTKKVAAPEGYLAGLEHEQPVVSPLTLLGFATEMVISPFAVGFLPKGAIAGSKLGMKAAQVYGNSAARRAVEYTFTPLRELAHKIASDTPFGAFMLQLRTPANALRQWPQMLDDLFTTERKARQIGGATLEKVSNLMAKHGLDEVSSNRVLDFISDSNIKLTAAERAAKDDIIETLLVPLWDRGEAMAYNRIESSQVLRGVKSIRGTIEIGGVKTSGPIRIPSHVAWNDPRREMLRPFIVAGRNMNKAPEALGRRTFYADTHVQLPWRGLSNYKYADLKEEQKDLAHALVSFINSYEKKLLLEERTRIGLVHKTATKTVPHSVRGLTPTSEKQALERAGTAGVPSRMPAGTAKGTLEAQLSTEWHNSGILLKWGPGSYWGKKGWNPALAGMNAAQGHYWISKVFDLTGHSRGRLSIVMNATGDRMWDNIDNWAAAQANGQGRRNRIFTYFYNKSRKLADPAVGYNWPAFSRTHHITGALLNNMMIATLGGNLHAALQNTSSLINISAKHDFPTMIRGLYKMIDMSEEGAAYRALRRQVDYGAEFKKVIFDDVWQQTGKAGFERLVMAPFTFMDNFVRGVAANVGIAQELERVGVKTAQELLNTRALAVAGSSRVDNIFLNKVVTTAARESIDTSFAYGLAGKSSLMMAAPLRIGMALQSYSLNQAEFLANMFARDGGSFVRYMALSGWVIDTADKIAGVNAESWVGWGFLPPNNIGNSPFVSTLKNLSAMAMGAANDDEAAVKQAVDSVRGNIREVFRLIGDPDDHEAFQVAMSSMGMMGFLPIPIIGVGRTAKSVNEFFTGQRQSISGRTWQAVDKVEAAKSWFFLTHRQAEDRRFATMEMSLRRQVQSELDKRTRKTVSALSGTNGDKLREAMIELTAPIGVKVPIGGVNRALQPAYFRVGDDRSFWPHPEMIETRLKGRINQLSISRDITGMYESGWLRDILWAEYVNRAMRELDRGGITALR